MFKLFINSIQIKASYGVETRRRGAPYIQAMMYGSFNGRRARDLNNRQLHMHSLNGLIH